MSKRPLSLDDLSFTTSASQPTSCKLLKTSGRQPVARNDGVDVEERNTARERNISLQIAAYSSAYSCSNISVQPALAESSVQACFQISNIPLGWDDPRILTLLAEECLTERATKLQLSPYPSTTGRSQVGVLTLAGPRDYIDAFPPLSHDLDNQKLFKLETSLSHQITIDRHFYGLTPLNRAVGEVIADIVAIPGLSGHTYGTWRHRDSGAMWLKDFLPGDLKGRVRVMTFGYNTSLTAPSTSTAGMVDFVRDLVQQLKTARLSVNNRPLILVGHGLECIIIAKGLLLCKLQEQNNCLLEATRLLVFFGAPHKGLRTEVLEEIVDDLQLHGSSRLREILSQLREHSKYLEEHAELLVDIWKDRKIISFYEVSHSHTVRKDPETGEWRRDGELVKMVQNVSSLLLLSNEERIPVGRSHSEIAKFNSPSTQGYDQLVGYMEEALEKIELKNSEIMLTDDHIKWRTSLQPSNYEDTRDNLLYKRHKNTCSWTLDEENYRLWNEHDVQPVLWINGGPGCGKSVLAAFLSKEILRGKANQLSMAYFFCDDKDERLRTASTVLANWLAQLLAQAMADYAGYNGYARQHIVYHDHDDDNDGDSSSHEGSLRPDAYEMLMPQAGYLDEVCRERPTFGVQSWLQGVGI